MGCYPTLNLMKRTSVHHHGRMMLAVNLGCRRAFDSHRIQWLNATWNFANVSERIPVQQVGNIFPGLV